MAKRQMCRMLQDLPIIRLYKIHKSPNRGEKCSGVLFMLPFRPILKTWWYHQQCLNQNQIRLIPHFVLIVPATWMLTTQMYCKTSCKTAVGELGHHYLHEIRHFLAHNIEGKRQPELSVIMRKMFCSDTKNVILVNWGWDYNLVKHLLETN